MSAETADLAKPGKQASQPDPAQPIKWHPSFTRQGVVLVADDGTHCWFNAQVLARHSSFIADLMEASLTGKLEDEPIPTDASVDDLEFYASLAHWMLGDPADVFACSRDYVSSVAAARTFLLLCDRLQSSALAKAYLDNVGPLSPEDAWDYFVLASERDHVDLGRRAICRFHGDADYWCCLADLDATLLAQVRPSWMLEMLRCLFSPNPAWSHTEQDWVPQIPMGLTSESFSPRAEDDATFYRAR